jgi:succinyl-diaminopimelate desuccinylase
LRDVLRDGQPLRRKLLDVVDEQVLAERLISYDTSRPEELIAAAGFVKGWLESRDIEVQEHEHNALPVLIAAVGPPADELPSVIFHGHLDVVPGRPEQFEPCVEGDRLVGRGAYDMKGALAAMMCALKDLSTQERVALRLICVPDEESEELDERSTDAVLADGISATFAVTGEPTNLHIGIAAKGVLAMQIVVHGRAAHSSTPWRGENAVLKAVDAFRAIQSLAFTRESSELFDAPSINLGRIEGGEALNMVPDACSMAVDVRYLPGQDPAEILAQIKSIEGLEIKRSFIHPPVTVPRKDRHVQALQEAVSRLSPDMETISVGRDGASDAVSFIQAGIPTVEFGPAGGGHHGPEEWVSLQSLARYRRTLSDFIRGLPLFLEEPGGGHRPRLDDPAGLKAIEGGLA